MFVMPIWWYVIGRSSEQILIDDFS
jgi:hypothetical protein